jgi:hypothetical protein
MYCRGVRTVKFHSDLEDLDKNSIPFERIRRYATFAKLAQKNEKVLFVTHENEENCDSEVSFTVENF